MKYLLAVGAALAVLLFPFSTHAQDPAALGFDGVDDYVAVPHTAALNAYPLTVTFWMKTPETSNQRGIVNKYVGSSGNGWQVYLDGPIVHAWYFNASGGSVFTLDGGNVGDGQWHHIAFTVDASGGRIYVDGVLKHTLAWAGLAGPCTTTQELRFGHYPLGSYFSGQLDEVAIWNVALSGAQIQSGLHRGLIGSEPNLVAYYRLDEGSGLTALSLPPGQNGTLLNGPLWVNSGGQVYPPTVSPQPASSVTTNAATLNASINPNGQTTTTWFKWGLTTNYGNFTTTNTLAATDVPVATSVGISGLLLATTYHFAAVASNSSGTTTGGDLTLTTVAPPTVTTLSASSVAPNTATLNGMVNPNGQTTTTWFQWGLTTNYGNFTTTNTLAASSAPLLTSAGVSGLLPATTYHFAALASNSSWTTTGRDLTLTTVAPPTVITLPATSLRTNAAVINGTVNPNGEATLCYFQYGLTTNYGNVTTSFNVGAARPVTFSRNISGLSPGTLYHFSLVANNNEGTSTGVDLTLTTPLPPPTVTTQPATSVSNTFATLNGNVNPNGTATTAWFEWSTLANNYTQQTAPVGMGSGSVPLALSNVMSDLVPGVVYYCRLTASNAWGLAYGAEIQFGSPAIILKGAALLTNECHTAYTDAGAFFPLAPLALAAGGYHNLALGANGTVIGWGYNYYGQTTAPANATNVVAIAAGINHSLALRADGTVSPWGDNYSGQTDVPASATNVVAIAGGGRHSLALRADGTVWAWGDNFSGQTTVPANATNGVAVAGGGYHSLALRAGGTVVAWGDNQSGQTDVPPSATNVVAIAAGYYHNLALRADGTVIGWGENSTGQTDVPASATNVVAIAGGILHSLALRADGTVLAWGDNQYGQIHVPATATNVVAIAAGYYHNLALRADGTVLAWGHNDRGQTNVTASLNLLPNPLNPISSGSVDTNSSGTYTITYTATNSLGGIGVLTRTVIVADRTSPDLTLSGANPLLWTRGVPFVEPGYAAPDTCQGDLSANIIITGTVNPNVLGTNTLTYTVTDASGNMATQQRLVLVNDRPSILSLTAQVTGTNSITGVRTVTLSATINPNGLAGTCFFQYGLNTSYAGLSATLPFPAAYVATNFTLSLSNLSLGTTYHFRAVATNSFGTTTSPDYAFFIPSAFPTGDLNGDGLVDQSEYNLVLSNYLATSPYLLITNAAGLGQSNVTFALSNSLGGNFTVEFSTDLANWQNLGLATPRYSFIDTNAPAAPQRYYRLKYP
jgi:alpha-tubulin suppressor-like RCC1 family protein